jgi:hypothetical protein
VRLYAGFGSLRELRWSGELGALPAVGEAVALPKIDAGYRVTARTWRLDEKPPAVEIYLSGGDS